jgi:hypothetical protein
MKMKIFSLKREKISKHGVRVENNRRESRPEEGWFGFDNRKKRVKSTILAGRYFQN